MISQYTLDTGHTPPLTLWKWSMIHPDDCVLLTRHKCSPATFDLLVTCSMLSFVFAEVWWEPEWSWLSLCWVIGTLPETSVLETMTMKIRRQIREGWRVIRGTTRRIPGRQTRHCLHCFRFICQISCCPNPSFLHCLGDKEPYSIHMYVCIMYAMHQCTLILTCKNSFILWRYLEDLYTLTYNEDSSIDQDESFEVETLAAKKIPVGMTSLQVCM